MCCWKLGALAYNPVHGCHTSVMQACESDMSDEEEEEHGTRDTESTGEGFQSLHIGGEASEVGISGQERQEGEVGPPVRVDSCWVAGFREG